MKVSLGKEGFIKLNHCRLYLYSDDDKRASLMFFIAIGVKTRRGEEEIVETLELDKYSILFRRKLYGIFSVRVHEKNTNRLIFKANCSVHRGKVIRQLKKTINMDKYPEHNNKFQSIIDKLSKQFTHIPQQKCQKKDT